MLFDQASQAMQSGKWGEAEVICRKILAHAPKDFDALHMLAVICSEKGEYDEGERLFQETIFLDPNFPPCFYNYGLLLAKQKKYIAAIAQFDKALSLFPNFFPAHCDRGSALKELGRFDEALASLNKAAGLAPNVPMVWYNKGNVYFKKEDYHSALNDYDCAIKIDSNYSDAWLGRGNAFTGLKRYDEAFAAYDKALAFKPDLAEAWLARGNVFKDLKRYDEAFVAYDKALALKPDLAEAQCNEALIRLILGDTENGWKKYEYRWNTKLMRGWKRNFSQPLWLGDSDIKNKAILIHAEQGLGDTLMACRYIPMLATLGARVIAEVQLPLKSLLKNLEGISLLVAKGETIPHFDVHCPIMSLPLAFKTTMEAIPAKVPYLAVSKNIIEKWRSKLIGTEIKVGVAWAGNPNYPQDLDRSILLKNIMPILGVKGARYFSLQKDLRLGDREILDVNSQIVRLDQEINDFQDTAAIMMSLDLVLSSDTSIAHLAGALSRPIWVLLPFNPDWRWLLDRVDSPWYPTARLFRQTNRGDWSTVIDDVCVELEKLVTEKKADKAQ